MSAAPALLTGVLLPLSSDSAQRPKFSTPLHPSVHLLEKLRSEKKSEVELSTRQTPGERDPHEQPTFTTESFVHPVEPILYLPPLISKLPPHAVQPSLDPANSQSESKPPAVLTTETRLPDIDPVSLSLHRALHFFRPLDEKYASKPYEKAFNWSELRLPGDQEREWYCVAFRSRRREGSNGDELYDADRKAHEEAVQNGGLLMYWYGVPDPETGLNLATCIWQSRQHAVVANSRPRHIRAARLARDAYEIYTLERYCLRKRSGTMSVEIENYVDGEVGW